MVELGADGVLLVAMAGHDAVLVVVVVAEHELRLLVAARDADVVVLRQGIAAEDLILPVDAGTAAVFAGDAVVGAGVEVVGRHVAAEHARPLVHVAGVGLELVLVLHVVGDVQQVELLAQHVEREVGGVLYGGFARLAGLRGDEDDAVRALRTVDRGGRGVFQDVDRGDVVDVDVLKTVLHGEAVDDVERGGRLRDRRTAADGDVDVGARRTALRYDVHTGGLTREGLRRRGNGHVLEVVAHDRNRRAGQVFALDFGVADGYDLLHHHRRVGELEVKGRSPPPRFSGFGLHNQ